MDVAMMCLNALDTRGAIFDPLQFYRDDPWTENEKQYIRDALEPEHLEKVDAGYNYWRLSKFTYSNGYSVYSARRATWSMGGIVGYSIEDFTRRFHAYLNKDRATAFAEHTEKHPGERYG
jgi:hypothetical protein